MGQQQLKMSTVSNNLRGAISRMGLHRNKKIGENEKKK